MVTHCPKMDQPHGCGSSPLDMLGHCVSDFVAQKKSGFRKLRGLRVSFLCPQATALRPSPSAATASSSELWAPLRHWDSGGRKEYVLVRPLGGGILWKEGNQRESSWPDSHQSEGPICCMETGWTDTSVIPSPRFQELLPARDLASVVPMEVMFDVPKPHRKHIKMGRLQRNGASGQIISCCGNVAEDSLAEVFVV